MAQLHAIVKERSRPRKLPGLLASRYGVLIVVGVLWAAWNLSSTHYLHKPRAHTKFAILASVEGPVQQLVGSWQREARPDSRRGSQGASRSRGGPAGEWDPAASGRSGTTDALHKTHEGPATSQPLDSSPAEEQVSSAALNPSAGPPQAESSDAAQPPSIPRATREAWGLFECVAWRQTSNCTSEGDPEPLNDLSCASEIPEGRSGYCEVIDRTEDPEGQYRRVMQMHCDSWPSSGLIRAPITCSNAGEFASFASESLAFRPNGTLQEAHANLGDASSSASLSSISNNSTNSTDGSSRGIVFCVADPLMVSAFAAIRTLRSKGCTLPIELWYLPDELTEDTRLLKELLTHDTGKGAAGPTTTGGIRLRPIPVARRDLCHEQGSGKCFNVKVYAVYHSSFSSVMLLDTDNFAIDDPTYLFESPEFRNTGAIFWPDFWSPGNSIFNVGNTSMVWELTGVPFVDMHEQESGQLLVDRRRHARALDVLMFYATPDNILYRYGPVYGDKDLFRLAWMRAGEPFHMIQQPPGWAGQLKALGFCGMTMVQHDPEGKMLFMHRNGFKLDNRKVSRRQIWDTVIEWQPGFGRYNAPEWIPKRKRWGYKAEVCYGPQHDEVGYPRIMGVPLRTIQELESKILMSAYEAAELDPPIPGMPPMPSAALRPRAQSPVISNNPPPPPSAAAMAQAMRSMWLRKRGSGAAHHPPPLSPPPVPPRPPLTAAEIEALKNMRRFYDRNKGRPGLLPASAPAEEANHQHPLDGR